MKISDIYDNSKPGNPMLGQPRISSEWVTFYVDNCDIIDRYFSLNYGQRLVLANSEKDFEFDAESALYCNKYKLDKWWDTLSLKYNPIYNVEEHTRETIDNDNSITDDRMEGKREKTSTYKYGAVNTHQNAAYGESKQNVEYGSHVDNLNDNTTTNVAPFNSSAQHPKNWEDSNHVNQYGAQIVSTDNSPRIDNITNNTEGREDSATTTEQPVDVNSTRVEDLKQVLVRDREGNIGVMSTQNMIEQERRVAMFNFWDEFAKIIIGNCCMHVISDINPELDRGDEL